MRHAFKHDYWESNWGRLITSVDINDPTSYNARIFQRRFRVSFGLFKDVAAGAHV